MKNRNLTVVKTKAPEKSDSVKPVLDHTAFDKFVADLDNILEDQTEIARLTEAFEEYANKPQIGRAPSGVDRMLAENSISRDYRQQHQKCIAFDMMFDPDDNYEDPECRGSLKREIIGDRLALLLNSFPNNGPRAPEDFSKLLLEEVVGVQPNMCDLEAACRHLVRTSTFVPSIAEILAELKKQHELFEDRWGAADYIGDWQAKLKKVLAKAKEKHANDTH